MDEACLRVPRMGLCQRQFVDSVVEIMCLTEETGDSTHERTGRGSWGLPPPLPPQILGNSDFFGQ